MARRLLLISAATGAVCVAAVLSAVVYRSHQGVQQAAVPAQGTPTQGTPTQETSAAGKTAPAGAQPAGPAPTRVAVTAQTCEPAELTVQEGTTTFEILNRSSRVLEWEILDGVIVVEERENIAPGFTQRLTAKLRPGEYQITCGLLSNPRGRLHVTAGVASAGPARKPSLMELIGPIAEYKVFVTGETEALAEATRRLTDAVRAGDVAAARALYAPARVHYERIEPVAELFSDLDAAIDARADDHEKREQDPGFTGFHRLEYGLFAQNSAAGLAPVADGLDRDVEALKGRIRDLTIMPDKMVGGAAALIEEVAATKLSGEEDRYAHTDLADFWANIEGARKIVTLLQPLTARLDPAYQTAIDGNFAQVEAVLAKYRLPDGSFTPYDRLSDVDRLALKGPVTKLSEDLSRLRGILDLA